VIPTEKLLITTAIGKIAGILIALALIALALIALALWRGLRSERRYWEQHDHKHGFLYEFTKDFAAPLLLAILGGVLAYEFGKLRAAEAENQRKAAILRDIMTIRDGPDVAFFTAVGDRLKVHLRRYEKFRQSQSAGPMPRNDCQPESDAQKTALFDEFDERAIYFFYGMYRVARLDFLTTKGYILYPRIWMEEAFYRVTDKIIKDFMGGKKEDDLCASPVELAALYHYFGASKASYYTGSKRPDDAFPDLFRFNKMLENATQSTCEDPYVAELRKGFQDFRERLRKKRIPWQEIITSFDAIEGLDDYAFNTLFSKWYGYKKVSPDLPVEEELQNNPPKEFLRYPLDTFEFKSHVPAQKKKEWDEERQKAWETILNNLPDDFKAKQKSGSPST
jgi:hypothetical protein